MPEHEATNEFIDVDVDQGELPLVAAAPLDEIEQEQVTLWQSALNDSVTQNTAAFILGQRPMSEWDDYMTELKGMNVDQYSTRQPGARRQGLSHRPAGPALTERGAGPLSDGEPR